MRSILKFEINEAGRDFVVGDIHGSFDLVLEAMRNAKFDPAVDRLFSVGDTIDRGPGSHRCAKFLSLPYVHAVRGNHEDMFLDLYSHGVPHEDVLRFACSQNGMNWWLETPEDKRQEIIAAISQLPLAIEIETRRGTVGLIHADVPAGMDWESFLRKLEAGDLKTIETCLWGRSRIESESEEGVPGVDRIFVGHTPQWGGLTRYGNIYAIDTGAVFGHIGRVAEGHLTMANLVMKTESLLQPRQDLQLVELKDDGCRSTRPFGRYSI